MDSSSSNFHLSSLTPNPIPQPLPLTAIKTTTTTNPSAAAAASSSNTTTPSTYHLSTPTSPTTPTSTTTTSQKNNSNNNYRKKRTKLIPLDQQPQPHHQQQQYYSFHNMPASSLHNGRFIITSTSSSSSLSPSSTIRPKKRTAAITVPRKPDLSMPKVSPPPCTECGKVFSSEKALYGHMRCHPERHWRGIVPPKKIPLTNNNPSPSSPNHDDSTPDELEVANTLLLLSTGLFNMERGGGEAVRTGDENTKRMKRHAFDQYYMTSRKKPPPPPPPTQSSVVFPLSAVQHNSRNPNSDVYCSSLSSLGVSGEERRMIQAAAARMEEEEEEVEGEIERMRGHKCAICPKVFRSGQALGGHMRCHWEKPTSTSPAASSFPDTSSGGVGAVFEFDLNVPAAGEVGNSEEGFGDHDMVVENVAGSVNDHKNDDDASDDELDDNCPPPSSSDLQLGLRLGL